MKKLVEKWLKRREDRKFGEILWQLKGLKEKELLEERLKRTLYGNSCKFSK